MPYNGHYHHVANLHGIDDFDEPLAEFLTEAYLNSPPR